MKHAVLLIIIAFLSLVSCDLLSSSKSTTTGHNMYVFSNTAQTFYLIDYQTFKLVKRIPLNVPEGGQLRDMTLSTNKDHLFFVTIGPYPEHLMGFSVYDIEKEEFSNLFFTEMQYTGPIRIIAAEDESIPGLIYAHLRDFGTYTIDLFEQQIVETISEEHDFRMQKWIRHSPDNKWTAIHKIWNGSGGFHELLFYDKGSGFRKPEFILNKAGQDSIAIYDFKFSKDGRGLFLTYQLSDGRSRDIESYFGSYDLQTGELYESTLRFPWSLSGYFMAYSSRHDEVYTVGNNGQFYAIDPDTYLIKDVIDIPVEGRAEQSPILLSPGEEMAFVSYPFDNTIYAIDLRKREIVKSLVLEQPYTMIIP